MIYDYRDAKAWEWAYLIVCDPVQVIVQQQEKLLALDIQTQREGSLALFKSLANGISFTPMDIENILHSTIDSNVNLIHEYIQDILRIIFSETSQHPVVT